MESCEDTAQLVNTTYKNVVEELGPCLKQLVVAGRTYLKSIYGMVAANKNYTEALERVANLAEKSTLRGSSDIGAALHHLVDVNKEFQAQESNIMKSLEFDFLEAMEIAADKDTKLIGREQKRFSQLHKGKREAFEKSISTLKKSRRKQSVNTDKQLAHIKLMESTKERLDAFCHESLKEAIVQERMMYGTVLEKQCSFNKQLLIYHSKSCDLLQDNIKHWEGLAETKVVLPNHCFPLHTDTPKEKEFNFYTVEGAYSRMESPADAAAKGSPVRVRRREPNHRMSTISRLEGADNEGIYARPMIRAKSEFSLSTALKPSGTLPARFSRIVEYNGESQINYVTAVYSYEGIGDYQLNMTEGDIIKFSGVPNTTGWQFGDNMTTKRCGWFPISFTEPMRNGDVSHSSSSTIAGDEYEDLRDDIPPPPPPIDRIKNFATNQSESSDYGTLRKPMPRKALPVEPPVTPQMTHIRQLESSQKAIHRQSYQPEQKLPYRDAENGIIYSNVHHLQSMHL